MTDLLDIAKDRFSDGYLRLRAADYPWMTDDQLECLIMVCDLCGGYHHVGGKFKPCGKGIEINISYGFNASTFDFDGLTRAVIMAHDRCIRFEIAKPSSPTSYKLHLHKRHSREGDMYYRHPTIESAIDSHRRLYT